jgi:hypothetical protein
VGKVQAGDVHAGFGQLGEHLFGVGGRADGADDLGFSHMLHPLFDYGWKNAEETAYFHYIGRRMKRELWKSTKKWGRSRRF